MNVSHAAPDDPDAEEPAGAPTGVASEADQGLSPGELAGSEAAPGGAETRLRVLLAIIILLALCGLAAGIMVLVTHKNGAAPASGLIGPILAGW